ncbi:MAG: peptide chain release factor N(5)-glutamine methyltransferase [Candidatus Hydrogenedens sp.]|nr:peptide chain release factor N(5)-glutamine methyltransferase [Candidatus Hydrogenedens sp.]
MTIAERLRQAAASLGDWCDTPRLDAEILLAHALGVSRARLLADLNEPFDCPAFEPLLVRRLNHEPIAYILGTWEFFSMKLEVRPPVLVPRPETEHLVECALDHIRRNELLAPRILDLCTGTGCVAMALARHGRQAQVTATDIHPTALEVARSNAARYGLKVDVVESSLYDNLAGAEPFDLIVSNPPYVPDGQWEDLSPVITKHEDRGALLAGGDGLDLLRPLIARAPEFLRPGGLLAVEMGEEQGAAVSALFEAAGFEDITVLQDLAGHDRIVRGICTSN